MNVELEDAFEQLSLIVAGLSKDLAAVRAGFDAASREIADRDSTIDELHAKIDALEMRATVNSEIRDVGGAKAVQLDY